MINVSLGDVQRAEHVLHFTHDELGVDRVRVFALSHDLKEGHSSAIVVNQGSLAFVASLGSILFHLDSLNEDVILFVLVVVEEETTVEHNGVMLLGDLVSLGQVTVDVVLAIKFDLGQDTTAKSKRCLDCEVEAVFTQDWKHAGETHVDEICESVRLFVTLHRFLSAEHLVICLHLDVESEADDQIPSLHEFLEFLSAQGSISERLRLNNWSSFHGGRIFSGESLGGSGSESE